MMGYDQQTWGHGAWLAVDVMSLLFLTLLIAVAIWAVRSLRASGQPLQGGGARRSSAEDVLAERYARGEIDENAFLRERDLLRGAVGQRPSRNSAP